jgi:hypothetical protein
MRAKKQKLGSAHLPHRSKYQYSNLVLHIVVLFVVHVHLAEQSVSKHHRSVGFSCFVTFDYLCLFVAFVFENNMTFV